MTQVGKLFKTIPYLVRDIKKIHKDSKYVEDLIKTLLNNEKIDITNIVNIQTNNRDNIFHFHLTLKDSINKQNLNLKYKGNNIEFTFQYFEDPRSKTNVVNSYLFIETFLHLEEKELAKAFNEMVTCNGKELSLSIEQENLMLFNPYEAQYHYRNILLDKKELVINTCISFNISYEKIYTELNPNLIKQVCKDLNLTYKKLSYELGYKPDTINKAASTAKVSEQLRKAITLYLENLNLKHKINNINLIKQTLHNTVI
ncbi:hypothetical protein ACH5BK_02810 [Arcobacter sp. YIC-80]|uniref:hypothetical protein n=1 Tax=Arcobacter sp. YIC-80 TaxID=3376683 RepID=UPI00384C3692